MGAAAAGRLLMHGHDVRQWEREEAVVLLKQAFENSRERFVVFGVQIEKAAPMPQGREVDFIRPPREWRYKGDPVLVAQHSPFTAALTLEDVAEQAASGFAVVPGFGAELAFDHRRHERVRVDLAMGMAERDADRLASVLEDVNVADVRQQAQLTGAVAPNLDEVLDLLHRLLTER